MALRELADDGVPRLGLCQQQPLQHVHSEFRTSLSSWLLTSKALGRDPEDPRNLAKHRPGPSASARTEQVKPEPPSPVQAQASPAVKEATPTPSPTPSESTESRSVSPEPPQRVRAERPSFESSLWNTIIQQSEEAVIEDMKLRAQRQRAQAQAQTNTSLSHPTYGSSLASTIDPRTWSFYPTQALAPTSYPRTWANPAQGSTFTPTNTGRVPTYATPNNAVAPTIYPRSTPANAPRVSGYPTQSVVPAQPTRASTFHSQVGGLTPAQPSASVGTGSSGQASGSTVTAEELAMTRLRALRACNDGHPGRRQ
ncbi:hypothetical protein HJFPF1_07633 [Paramyrothecium foliicola]|nr:hypothetical protein HJFPF1_07633 [Paramyrothecium foliicola]